MRTKLHVLLFALAIAAQAHAISFISTNTYTVGTGETVAEEQWVSAVTAITEGTFKKDLFIMAGGELLLNGTYEGNVWGANSAGAKMSGTCRRNVRLIGKTVRLDGSVNGNAMALADTISITTNTVVAGSMKLFGNSIVLEGITKGDVSITASRIVTLSGIIEGNVDITAVPPCEIILQRDTRIGGNLTYTASKELVPAEGIVSGQIKRSLPQPTPAFSKPQLISRLMWFFAAFIAGVPFISLFPMTTAIASQLVRTSPWRCLWVGALCSLALPMFGIMCISSIIGIPLGALLFGGWAFMVYTSRIIMGLVIGTLVLRSSSTSFGRVLLAMSTGLAIIYVAASIPAISLSVNITFISMGSGALLLGLFQKRRLIIQMPDELKRIEELKKQNNNKQEDN
jgi:cytoskeletal protein CcmA (bactofilin family)